MSKRFTKTNGELPFPDAPHHKLATQVRNTLSRIFPGHFPAQGYACRETETRRAWFRNRFQNKVLYEQVVTGLCGSGSNLQKIVSSGGCFAVSGRIDTPQRKAPFDAGWSSPVARQAHNLKVRPFKSGSRNQTQGLLPFPRRWALSFWDCTCAAPLREQPARGARLVRLIT